MMSDAAPTAAERGALRKIFCYACNRFLADGPWDAIAPGRALEIRCGKCRARNRVEAATRPPDP
jgi:phage FluMu protein Com